MISGGRKPPEIVSRILIIIKPMNVSEIIDAIEPLINGIAYFKQASKRYNYFFNLDTYKKDGKELKNIEKIEIKDLSYSYDNNENFAIKDINITIKKGEKIYIKCQIDQSSNFICTLPFTASPI